MNTNEANQNIPRLPGAYLMIETFLTKTNKKKPRVSRALGLTLRIWTLSTLAFVNCQRFLSVRTNLSYT